MLILLLGMILGYMYQSQMDVTASIPPVSPTHQLTSLRAVESLSIDYSLLENAQFKSLRVFGQMPVRPESGGTTDPFQ